VQHGYPPLPLFLSLLDILIILLQVINFTTRQPDESQEGWRYVWSNHDNVQVIHVWHDLEWTTAKITERRKDIENKHNNKQKHEYIYTTTNLNLNTYGN
jgi:hypothetical protein